MRHSLQSKLSCPLFHLPLTNSTQEGNSVLLSSLDRKLRAMKSEGACPRPHRSPRATAEVLPPSGASPGSTISFLHVHFDSRKEALKKCRPGALVGVSVAGQGLPQVPSKLLVLITWKAQRGHGPCSLCV